MGMVVVRRKGVGKEKSIAAVSSGRNNPRWLVPPAGSVDCECEKFGTFGVNWESGFSFILKAKGVSSACCFRGR